VEPILPRQRGKHISDQPMSISERIGLLAPDQVTAGLEWLATHEPHIFRAVVRAAEIWDDGTAPGSDARWERYCVVCGGQPGITVAVGDDWRHYPGDRPPGPYDAGHQPVIGWRRVRTPIAS
jgi:hypothetical protein